MGQFTVKRLDFGFTFAVDANVGVANRIISLLGVGGGGCTMGFSTTTTAAGFGGSWRVCNPFGLLDCNITSEAEAFLLCCCCW